MSRHLLPETLGTGGSAAFFPSFQKEMNRLLEQFKSGFPLMETEGPAAFGGAGFPAIDVIETDDAVEVSAEVPGVKEDDLDVSVAGQTLVLKGEKSSDREEKEENYHLIERHYGSFRRQIPLGFAPDDGAVEAQFSDGVLKLTIAKPAAAKTGVQKIDIKKT